MPEETTKTNDESVRAVGRRKQASARVRLTPNGKGEILVININATTTAGTVMNLGKKGLEVELKRPIAAEKGSKLALSRMVGNRWRLIGTAELA